MPWNLVKVQNNNYCNSFPLIDVHQNIFLSDFFEGSRSCITGTTVSWIYLNLCNSDCRFDKRHIFVYRNNSTVSIGCSWNGSDVYGSAGFIFGVIVYDPNARCLMRSARVLTISSASKEPECITSSLFQDWCSKLTNAKSFKLEQLEISHCIWNLFFSYRLKKTSVDFKFNFLIIGTESNSQSDKYM